MGLHIHYKVMWCGVGVFVGRVPNTVLEPIIYIYTLVPTSYRCFIYNLALIGQAVSEKKIFEKCVWMTDQKRSKDDLNLN